MAATLVLAGLLAATLACVGPVAPEPVRHAISALTRHLPGYVAECNRVLAASGHPDGERLIGTGERLVAVAESLDRWAGGAEVGRPADARREAR